MAGATRDAGGCQTAILMQNKRGFPYAMLPSTTYTLKFTDVSTQASSVPNDTILLAKVELLS